MNKNYYYMIYYLDSLMLQKTKKPNLTLYWHFSQCENGAFNTEASATHSKLLVTNPPEN